MPWRMVFSLGRVGARAQKSPKHRRRKRADIRAQIRKSHYILFDPLYAEIVGG